MPQRSPLSRIASGIGERNTHGRKGLVDEEYPGAAIAHGVFVLQRAPADVERHDHRAGPAGREIKFEIAVGIQREHRNAIAGRSAERADAGGELCHAVADLAPVLAPVATDNGKAVRIDL
jgi:hypothetical protein